MNETVKLILSLSLSGSILAALIFTMKPFIKHRFTKSIQYYIWLVVLLRLALPFSFETSIMNQLFYGNQTSVVTTSQTHVQTGGSSQNIPNSSFSPDSVQENVKNGAYNYDADHTQYFNDLFNQYVLYLWLLGVLIVFTVNLTGYARFCRHLKQTNKPASSQETRILKALWHGHKCVTLVRNPFVGTPMLTGLSRPLIIIPDLYFNETQLKNILLHELTHLRRFDIAVKWLTMIITSLHWFNPAMYFIKKEINHACELACDEAVIANLDASEKQAYGDTLIALVSAHKYPMGVLSTTMCEEKRSLKERLTAIMQHSQKSRFIIGISVLLLIAVAAGGVLLGAGVGTTSKTPPQLYIASEFEKTKEARTAGYRWENHGTVTIADAAYHPRDLDYRDENIIDASASEQLIISTQKIKMDKKYNFKLTELNIYKNNSLVKLESPESYIDNCLYLQAPSETGDYVYCLTLKYNQGTVNYGFVVRVLDYHLTAISQFKTPYVGNHVKVLGLAGSLPAPDKCFRQQFISMVTDKRPYKLNVFYETKANAAYAGQWPIVDSESSVYYNLQKNALVLFCMIDNLDELTFSLRNSPSVGDLDTSKYDTSFSYRRDNFEAKYGDLTRLGQNLEELRSVLTAMSSPPKVN